MPNDAGLSYDKNQHTLYCEGDWDLSNLPKLETLFKTISWPSSGEVIFDGENIKKMDSAGAWLLINEKQNLEKKRLTVQLENFSSDYSRLISIIYETEEKESPLPKIVELNWLEKLGQSAVNKKNELVEYLSFIGILTFEMFRIVKNSKHMRWDSLTNAIYTNGYLALPIIALLSFMIGVVIAYQLAIQLRTYGASIYMIEILGASILREFGPLLTAIMVAGRTGASFTAQLGIMKINQEIDALDTIGITSSELLVLPRIVGLLIAMPLITIWADIFGILGGMIMSNSMLNISWYDFLARFPQVVKLKSLMIGLGKAPVFAFIIATIGCFKGLNVEDNADSVGRNTTRSVVLAIFFIIISDAAFSVIFSKLRL